MVVLHVSMLANSYSASTSHGMEELLAIAGENVTDRSMSLAKKSLAKEGIGKRGHCNYMCPVDDAQCQPQQNSFGWRLFYSTVFEWRLLYSTMILHRKGTWMRASRYSSAYAYISKVRFWWSTSPHTELPSLAYCTTFFHTIRFCTGHEMHTI